MSVNQNGGCTKPVTALTGMVKAFILLGCRSRMFSSSKRFSPCVSITGQTASLYCSGGGNGVIYDSGLFHATMCCSIQFWYGKSMEKQSWIRKHESLSEVLSFISLKYLKYILQLKTFLKIQIFSLYVCFSCKSQGYFCWLPLLWCQ